MVALGFEPHFSGSEITLIVIVVVGSAIVAATPATVPLMLVGQLRGTAHPGWNACWYWLWGTLLTLPSMGLLFFLHLSWWSVPLSWPLPWFLAWLLHPRRKRRPADPGDELSWGDMTTGRQGER